MTRFQKQVMLKVGAVHFIAIFLMAVIPLLRGCFKPKPPKEMITFIEIGSPGPPVEITEVSSLPEPIAPPPDTVVEPPSEPDPVPEAIPEPVKPKEKVKLKPPEKPKPPKEVAPKPKPVEKPKPKYVKPSEIKIGPKVESAKPKPKVDTSAIRKNLQSWAKSGGSTSGNPSEFNDYFLRVRNAVYGAWTPPASADPRNETVVRVHILKNGQIIKRAKIAGSGDPVYDRIVMEAVNALSTLPVPPANYPYDFVEIVFTLN